MDRSLIKTLMPSLVAGHVPRNVRSFKYRVFDDQPQSSTLGFVIDPQPFDGKVVAASEDAIVVKLKPSEFAVLDPSLVTTVPSEGKVHVQPYARRRFDGLRADTPEERTEMMSDGTPYTVKTHILGSAPAKLPIPEPQCLNWVSSSSSWRKCRRPTGSGASPTCWSMRAPTTSPGSIRSRPGSSKRPGDQFHGFDREVRRPGDDPLPARQRYLCGGAAPRRRVGRSARRGVLRHARRSAGAAHRRRTLASDRCERDRRGDVPTAPRCTCVTPRKPGDMPHRLSLHSEGGPFSAWEIHQRESPGCRLMAASRARRGHAEPMPADVVSDMPGNHRSSRLRRSSHCVTEPARTASIRERPPVSGGGCFRLINPSRGYAPFPQRGTGVSPLHPYGDSP